MPRFEPITDEALKALRTPTDQVRRRLIDGVIARMEAAEAELRNIADADPGQWDDPTDFRAWAQSRARHTLEQNAGGVTRSAS